MQVSLKKARKLQADLKSIASGVELIDTVKVSAYTDYSIESIQTALTQKQVELTINLDTYNKIVVWIYAIRGAVAEQNKAAGIDLLMTSLAYTNEMITKYSSLVPSSKNKQKEDLAVTVKKLDIAKQNLTNANGPSMYGRSSEEVSMLVMPSVDETLKTLKRTKTEIEDQLTALNAMTKIDLAEDLESFLKSEGLI